VCYVFYPKKGEALALQMTGILLKADIPLSSKLFAIRCASFFFPLEFK
jgi:hypothetical protein